MLNNPTKIQTPKHSKFLGERRKQFLNKKPSLAFIRQNQGGITVRRIETGAYRCIFHSRTTGRRAHAFGNSFGNAYRNMIRLYNLKYSA